MSEGASSSDRAIDSLANLAIGDGVYSEQSESVYWVDKITGTKVVLRDTDDSPHVWRRETLERSFEAHTWVRQCRSSSTAGHTSHAEESE